MSDNLPPFSSTYSPGLADLLRSLGVSLAISTYQAGKVIFISARNEEQLVLLPRNFDKPMGMAFDQGKLAVATKNAIQVLVNAPRLAPNHPRQPSTYDALFIPRATHYTGLLDIHDLNWVGNQLWAVNTLFSCICTISYEHTFTPVWKPFFISDLASEDRCHLNGVAFENGLPKYVTALGQTNEGSGWRKQKSNGGVLMDVTRNEIVAAHLPMPHSPRLYKGELLGLHSATGDLVRYDLTSGKFEVLRSLNGFVRGMDRIGDYLFIGLSKLRETSTAFNDLPISKKSLVCGVIVIHIPSMEIAGEIKFENSVEEIYEVKVLPGLNRPGLLSMEKNEQQYALTTPNMDFWGAMDKK